MAVDFKKNEKGINFSLRIDIKLIENFHDKGIRILSRENLDRFVLQGWIRIRFSAQVKVKENVLPLWALYILLL